MRSLHCLLLAALVACGSAPADHGNGVVSAWNAAILETAESEDGFLTLKGVRTTAMAHLAMRDALRSLDDARRSDVDPVAVASHAAYAVAVAEYPDQADRFATLRGEWGSRDTVATAIGTRAAAAVLARRADDGWDREASYRWHPMGPGVYAEFSEHSGTPEGFVFGAGWAAATPFTLVLPDQFRPGPPPAIGSAAYLAAYREVKEVGAQSSASRTADHSHLAMWWKEFVEKSHNRLARELVAREDLDLYAAARLFALLNAAIFDGYVASFEAKFHYNHWRPYTAIRWAANDGNPATEPDTSWTNLHDHTYAFPSYPSAHGTVCGAASVILADVFGEHYPFTMTITSVDSQGPLSPPVAMEPASRAFDSFSEAAEECGVSRVYLGIHFRYDSDAGVALGRAVGHQVVASDSLRR